MPGNILWLSHGRAGMLLQPTGFVSWLGLNWAGTGGMLGLAQTHLPKCLQSHPKSFYVGRLPAKKLPFHSHISVLAQLSKVHLQGLVQSCPDETQDLLCGLRGRKNLPGMKKYYCKPGFSSRRGYSTGFKGKNDYQV